MPVSFASLSDRSSLQFQVIWWFQATQFLFKPLSFYFFIILQLRIAFYCSYVRLLFCPQFLVLSNSLLCHFVIIFFVSFLFCCLIFNPFNCSKTLICFHPERLGCFLPFHCWYWPLKMWDRCQLIKSKTSSCIYFKNKLFHLRRYLQHIKILFKRYIQLDYKRTTNIERNKETWTV